MMITSPANPKVKLVRGLQTRRRLRYREKLLVAEGARLVQDAMIAGFPPRFVLCTAEWAESESGQIVQGLLAHSDGSIAIVADDVMAQCADTETPQGVLAVFPMPMIPPPPDLSLVLVIDQLRDPGNLGTILRTAAAAAVDWVLLPPGNVDPFSPKVVRAGMGAHFRLPIAQPGWAELESSLAGLDVWLAEAGTGMPYHQVDWAQPAALVIGGETGGAGQRAHDLALGSVHIPMPGGTESLNAAVACAVLLFEVIRQRSPLA
jgi:TrmH family RNA methyltransferase